MLQPKLGIFIVYGHDLGMKESAVEALEELMRAGYRVRPIVLDDRANVTSDSNFRNNLQSRLDEAKAAIILLSPDDLGLSRKDLQGRENVATADMERRPRQNVVWEYGYVSAKLSTREYLILTRPEASALFSDTSGLYVGRVSTTEEIKSKVGDFVRHRLTVIRNLDPLGDPEFAIDYGNLFPTGEPTDAGAIAFFERQFDALDNDDDRALFLLERIVFDVYLYREGWWRERLEAINFNSKRLRTVQSILLFVRQYMDAWRNPLVVDRMSVAQIKNHIEDVESRLADMKGQLAPIVSVVFHDYAGLTLHKSGVARRQRDDLEGASADLERSASHFVEVAEICARFEDENLPLWRGFAAFNLARVLRELHDVDRRRFPEDRWSRAYSQAIAYRRRWTSDVLLRYRFPTRLREGLEAEVLHALVKRRRDALRNRRGKITESSEYRIDNDFDEMVEREYGAWLKRPEQDRVRLAEMIRSNYAAVETPSRKNWKWWF